MNVVENNISKPKRVYLEATIIRANGNIEPLGIIADTKLSFKVYNFLSNLIRKIL